MAITTKKQCDLSITCTCATTTLFLMIIHICCYKHCTNFRRVHKWLKQILRHCLSIFLVEMKKLKKPPSLGNASNSDHPICSINHNHNNAVFSEKKKMHTRFLIWTNITFYHLPCNFCCKHLVIQKLFLLPHIDTPLMYLLILASMTVWVSFSYVHRYRAIIA